MLEAAMVENHVHHHLQPVPVRLVGQSPIVGIGAEARVYLVEVCRRIAVIGAGAVTVGRVVLQHRGKP